MLSVQTLGCVLSLIVCTICLWSCCLPWSFSFTASCAAPPHPLPMPEILYALYHPANSSNTCTAQERRREGQSSEVGYPCQAGAAVRAQAAQRQIRYAHTQLRRGRGAGAVAAAQTSQNAPTNHCKRQPTASSIDEACHTTTNGTNSCHIS